VSDLSLVKTRRMDRISRSRCHKHGRFRTICLVVWHLKGNTPERRSDAGVGCGSSWFVSFRFSSPSSYSPGECGSRRRCLRKFRCPQSTLQRRRAGSIGVIENSLSGHSEKGRCSREIGPRPQSAAGRVVASRRTGRCTQYGPACVKGESSWPGIRTL
jgi:hypothetical protein